METQTEGTTAEPSLPIHFKPLVSSQLRAMAWLDPQGFDALEDKNVDTATLVIIFNSGAAWAYRDVPRVKAKGLLEAVSAGKFFGAQIKGTEANPTDHQAKLVTKDPLSLGATITVSW